MIALFKRLFLFSGRIGRLSYAAVGLGACATAFAFLSIVLQMGVAEGFDAEKLALVLNSPSMRFFYLLYILSLWIACANNSKRLHDFGMSGWWQLAPLGALFGLRLIILAVYPLVTPDTGFSMALIGFVALSETLACRLLVLGSLGFAAMMLFRRGDAPDNRFGPAPGAAPRSRDEIRLTAYRAPRVSPRGFGQRRANAA